MKFYARHVPRDPIRFVDEPEIQLDSREDVYWQPRLFPRLKLPRTDRQNCVLIKAEPKRSLHLELPRLAIGTDDATHPYCSRKHGATSFLGIARLDFAEHAGRGNSGADIRRAPGCRRGRNAGGARRRWRRRRRKL